MSAGVELKDVSVTFGSFFAAKNVNVKIEGGEFFSFLGPSGCGKTTFVTTLLGKAYYGVGLVEMVSGRNCGPLSTGLQRRDHPRCRYPGAVAA